MDAKKLKNDIIIYALLLLACIALYFWLTPQEIVLRSAASDSSFTPQTFPNLLTGGIALCSAIGLIASCVKYRKVRPAPQKKAEKPHRSRHEWMSLLAPYITFVLLIVYCILFESLGYLLSTLLIAPVLVLFFGGKKWWHVAVVFGFALLMFVLFKYVLLVPLR